MSSPEEKFVPKPLILDGPTAERQLQFLAWIQTYEGLESPVGLEGLRQLRAFIDNQAPYVSEGKERWAFEASIGPLPTNFSFAGFWMSLDLVSVNGQNWGQVKYFEYLNHWMAPSTEEIPTGERPAYVIQPDEKMASVPIDAFLQAFAALFTIKAHEALCDTYLKDVKKKGWFDQAQLLRTAHAFESALLILNGKTKTTASA